MTIYTIYFTPSALGVGIGGSIAAPAAVTLFGSEILGTWAVSAGVIAAPAAPIAPLLVCGAVGAAIGYAGYKTVKNLACQNIQNEINASIDNDLLALNYIELEEENIRAKLKIRYEEIKNEGISIRLKEIRLNEKLEVIKYKLASEREILVMCNETGKSYEDTLNSLREDLEKFTQDLRTVRLIRIYFEPNKG